MAPDLLYLVHRVPYPPDKGDRIRNFHLLRFLAQRCRVHLACLADEPVLASSLIVLQGLCKRLAFVTVDRRLRWWRALTSLLRGQSASEGAFASPDLASTIQTWAKETNFHAALASSSSLTPYLRQPGLAGIPAVVDLIDLDSQKWLDYAAESWGLKRWLYRLEAGRLRRCERDLASWARGITLVSTAEADLYRQCCGVGAGLVHAVSNGVDLDYFQVPAAAPTCEPVCVFVGALDYRPNVDGACWFCREVWPAIRQARSDARLLLVGRKPNAAVLRLAELPGVSVVADVPDVRPYLAAAAVVIAPLRIARGIQNKVLEALAMGKATLASPQALEGLPLMPGREALSASSPQEWVQALLRLLADVDLRRQLGQAGRRYVEEHHRWETCLHPMARLLSLSEPRP